MTAKAWGKKLRVPVKNKRDKNLILKKIKKKSGEKIKKKKNVLAIFFQT